MGRPLDYRTHTIFHPEFEVYMSKKGYTGFSSEPYCLVFETATKLSIGESAKKRLHKATVIHKIPSPIGGLRKL